MRNDRFRNDRFENFNRQRDIPVFKGVRHQRL